MIKAGLLVALLALPVIAQDKLDVTVRQVNDRRTSGSFSQLAIYLELPKVRAAEVAATRVFISTAVDDSGRSLIDADAREPELEPSRGGMGKEDEGSAEPAVVSLTLKNPDRKATTVKEVRGEVELYMPSRDPNSTAEVAKFLSFSGKPLSHRALKANGVEIALVSPAQLAAEKKRLGEAKRKSARESGWEGQDLEGIVSSYLQSLLTIEEGDLLLRIKDPNKRIQSISYVDPAGEVKRAMMRQEEGMTILSTWGDKPKADWKLRVSMTTPKNLVRRPFALADVPLP